MHTQVMKWISIAALLLAVVFWNSAANFQPELNLVVCVAAAVVLIQAFQLKKYSWAAGFLMIALLFNPAVPVFRRARGVGLSLVVPSIAPFCDLVDCAKATSATVNSIHHGSDSRKSIAIRF